MAFLLGVTVQRLNQLVAAGVLPKLGRGRFDPPATVQAYIAHRAADAAQRRGDPATERLRTARAAEVELRLARSSGELVRRQDAEDEADIFVGQIMVAWQLLPGMASRHIVDRAARLRERDRLELLQDDCRAYLSRHLATLLDDAPVFDFDRHLAKAFEFAELVISKVRVDDDDPRLNTNDDWMRRPIGAEKETRRGR
ncbi:hypothetical protein BQ8794_10017 [Mesorhizobium prunaredense]|uniref:Uncharacterized protein n=1 Tax=Mesorhizobium prunaredense TaxID=1631249 RepID=A0A1R3UYE7_9HYPH|nr:hypothetical protein [Mesorhizobium prunaredense]SIT52647.1 hypothetical protein BQ8794_10017 [Mesorhizobium prunaredense]